MANFSVNDRVILKQSIYDPPSEDGPGGYCGLKGDVVIIRAVRSGPIWPYSVSHEDRVDGNTFSVDENEIEKEVP